MTSRQDIAEWFDRGVQQGATHMIVACDTFDHSDYPVYVMPGEDPRDRARAHLGPMQQLMEVYALHLDKWDQLMEPRAFHYDASPDKVFLEITRLGGERSAKSSMASVLPGPLKIETIDALAARVRLAALAERAGQKPPPDPGDESMFDLDAPPKAPDPLIVTKHNAVAQIARDPEKIAQNAADLHAELTPAKKTRRELTEPRAVRHEKYMSYMRGWYDGAGRKGMRQEFQNHPRADLVSEYHRGYTEGQEASRAASTKAARRLRYKPTILRLAR